MDDPAVTALSELVPGRAGRRGGGGAPRPGQSWGGLLAQLAAFRHPGLVAGLVLVDPAHEEILASAPWQVRGLVLDAYAASYRSRSRVGMLSVENRLSVTSVPAIRQIRAASALPDVPVPC